MSDIGKIIEQRRKELNLTLEQVGNFVGVGKSTVKKWESGSIENMKRDKIALLSKILQIAPTILINGEGIDTEIDYNSIPGIMPLPKTVKRPRLGTIACGEPILAEENFDGYDDVPDGIPCDFTLICEGDSMINARIHDGDIVYIKQQPTVENGQIAAIMIDGETTLKRVYIDGDRLTTIPENPAYKPHTYIGEELNNIRIIGLATGFTSILT